MRTGKNYKRNCTHVYIFPLELKIKMQRVMSAREVTHYKRSILSEINLADSHLKP